MVCYSVHSPYILGRLYPETPDINTASVVRWSIFLYPTRPDPTRPDKPWPAALTHLLISFVFYIYFILIVDMIINALRCKAECELQYRKKSKQLTWAQISTLRFKNNPNLWSELLQMWTNFRNFSHWQMFKKTPYLSVILEISISS